MSIKSNAVYPFQTQILAQIQNPVPNPGPISKPKPNSNQYF